MTLALRQLIRSLLGQSPLCASLKSDVERIHKQQRMKGIKNDIKGQIWRLNTFINWPASKKMTF
jgi:hypothetical protein